MDLEILIQALVGHDPLTARQWVADAARAGFNWSIVSQPENLDATDLAIAAGIVELLAQRAGQIPPTWTSSVPAAPESVFLVRSAASMPNLRRLCEKEGPEPLRRRNVLAPPEFLTVA